MHEIYTYKVLYLFLLPGVVWLVLFQYAPMAGLITVFQHYDPLRGLFTSPWAGLSNFTALFKTPTFSRALKNTLFISALKIVIEFPLPIIFALLLNELRVLKFKKVVQTMTYLPNFVSWVIAAGIWYALLDRNTGVVNNILMKLGLHQPIYFMGSYFWFYFVLILSDVWKNVGFSSILYLSSIASVDQELYQAATVDGAGRFKQAIHITLPHMKMLIAIQFAFAVSNILNAGLDQLYTMSNVMVINISDIIDTAVLRYLVGADFGNLSVGAALGFFKGAIGLVLFIIVSKVYKKVSGESLLV